MRILALLLAGLPAVAAPVITRVNPSYGFRYGYTHVQIDGSGFTDGNTIFCPTLTCPVQVFFGPYQAAVHEVTPRFIRTTVHLPSPVPDGTEVGVRVVIEGKGETAITHAFTFTDAAGGAENYAQYLVPFTGETIPGANGSQWKGELTFFNASTNTAVLLGPFGNPIFQSPPQMNLFPVGPGSTAKPTLYGSGSTAGAFVYVPLPLADDIRKSLRVRDLSRNANSWGTEIPVISRDQIAEVITLIDIPTDPQYRATLRIYHWGEWGGLPARVTVYVPDRKEPVAQFEMTSHASRPPENTGMPFYPSYSQMDLLTPAIRAAGPALRVEIDNLGRSSRSSPPLPGIWAFVSVTNNDTQQVTVMTP